MDKFRQFCRKYLKSTLLISAVLALIMNVFIETMARHSLFETFRFFAESPLVFLFNVFIISQVIRSFEVSSNFFKLFFASRI